MFGIFFTNISIGIDLFAFHGGFHQQQDGDVIFHGTRNGLFMCVFFILGYSGNIMYMHISLYVYSDFGCWFLMGHDCM